MSLATVRSFFRDPWVPRWKKALGVGALLYVILPIDVVPDFVPLLGWLDDVGIVAMIVSYLAKEIRAHSHEVHDVEAHDVSVIDGQSMRVK